MMTINKELKEMTEASVSVCLLLATVLAVQELCCALPDNSLTLLSRNFRATFLLSFDWSLCSKFS